MPVEIPCGLGLVSLEGCESGGLSTEVIDAGTTLRFRHGGERLKPIGRAHTHSVAALCQEAGVPPWERERTPMLTAGERILAFGDRWVDQRAVSVGPGWRLAWRRP